MDLSIYLLTFHRNPKNQIYTTPLVKEIPPPAAHSALLVVQAMIRHRVSLENLSLWKKLFHSQEDPEISRDCTSAHYILFFWRWYNELRKGSLLDPLSKKLSTDPSYQTKIESVNRCHSDKQHEIILCTMIML
jgi:hypothetical protein